MNLRHMLWELLASKPVRLTVRGLLSTSIASVGISADVGGYAQVWGYLYYELKYTARRTKQPRYGELCIWKSVFIWK